MPLKNVRHALVAVMLLVAMLVQGTWALAGTTGSLTGNVVDQSTGKPVANAKITANSPSQTATAITDAGGHFAFVSLAPDTYTLSVDKEGYQSVSQAGLTVFADQSQNVAIQVAASIKTIAKVTSRAAGALVKSGTTADVYSVNATVANSVKALGGGGSLNSAYSAIASQPGVFVPQGQGGWAQSVYVRGSNYTQIGYEFDGVPVQRSFDQYPATALSALGQQELQVYTGAAPADAQSSSIGGFINQVIKTGTYPGFGDVQFGLGAPTYYHHMEVEAGGATPNRLFSYYAGIAGYNQDFTYASRSNGANLDAEYGSPYNLIAQDCGQPDASAGCYANAAGFFGALPTGPYGFAKGPFSFGITSMIADREAVGNFHFGIPHHNDAGRDDLQLLYDVSFLQTQFPTSFNDWNYAENNVANGTAVYNGQFYGNCGDLGELNPDGTLNYTGTPCALLGGVTQNYTDKSVYTGNMGGALGSGDLNAVAPFYQPGSPKNRAFGAQTPNTERDFYSNNSAIVKLQYQKNIGSNAYARIYGYTFYSDWLQQALSGATIDENFVGAVTPDYSVITHTSGVVAQFADQINAQHLLNFTAGYTHASTIRWNDGWYGASPTVGVAVDSTNPTNGFCYGFKSGAAVAMPCSSSSIGQYVLPPAGGTSLAPKHSYDPTVDTIGSFTCGNGPCEYYTVGAGYSGAYNTVTPEFTNFALEDTWRPTNNLVLNLGLHYDDFKYLLADTTQAPAFLGLGSMTGPRTLFQNSFNNWYCYGTAQGLFASSTPDSCPAGTAQATWSNISPKSNDYSAWEPRLGGTFTLNPQNVFRVSWGKYEQPGSSAYQQYQNTNNDLPLASPNKSFYALGFTNAAHKVYPEESYNLDFSWEHQVKGTDWSWKVTPYLRKTKNEIFSVLLDPRTNFVSGVNVGRKTVAGVELAIQKGDFNRNGLAGMLSYTYTYGRVKFDTLANGSTVTTGINQAISQYNAYTSACAQYQADPSKTAGVPQQCLTPALPGVAQTVATPTNGLAASPCYDNTGNGVDCSTSGAIANPYWNAAPQALYSASNNFVPYNQLPGAGASSVSSSYIIPHVATLVLNYKHDKFSITPSVQLAAGGKYGSPTQGQGIDPASCGGALGSAIAGDPRYPYGAAGGSPYDAQTCSGAIVTPDLVTGKFDNFGQFTEPTQVTANLQMSYEVSPKVTLSLIATNLYNSCFGGSKEAWNTDSKTGCWYTGSVYNGNFYNPGNVQEGAFKYPYTPTFGNVFQSAYGGQANPINLYLTAQIKL